MTPSQNLSSLTSIYFHIIISKYLIIYVSMYVVYVCGGYPQRLNEGVGFPVAGVTGSLTRLLAVEHYPSETESTRVFNH